MPKVTGRYIANRTLRPIPNVSQGPRANADDFGRSIGASLRRGAADLQQGASSLFAQAVQRREELQQKQDLATVRDAMNTERDTLLKLRAQLSGLEGKDGLDVYERARKHIEKRREEGAAGLKNERQRELFIHSFDARADGLLNWAASQQARNVETFRTVTLDAEARLLLEEAKGVYGGGELQDVLGRVKANRKARFGAFGEDVVALETGKAVSAVHESNVDLLINGGQVEAAREYLDRHTEEIQADHLPRIGSTVEAAEGKARLDGLLREYAAMGTGAGVDRALRELGDDPALQRQVVSHLQFLDTIRQRQQAEADSQRAEALQGQLDQLVETRDYAGLRDSVQGLPPGERPAANRYIESALNADAGFTDMDEFYAAEDSILAGQPVDWMELSQAVGAQDLRRLKELRDKVQAGQVNTKDLGQLRSEFDYMARNAGVETSADRKALYDRWRTEVRLDEIPGMEEARTRLGEFFRDVTLEDDNLFGIPWQRTRTVPQYKAQEMLDDGWRVHIPRDNREQIEEELRRAGQPVTDENIQRLWSLQQELGQ